MRNIITTIARQLDPAQLASTLLTSGLLASALLASAWLLATPTFAHDLTFSDTVVLFKADGTYQVDLQCDLDALALGASPTAPAEELVAQIESLDQSEKAILLERLRAQLDRRVRLKFDDETTRAAISFPHQGTELAMTDQGPTVLGLIARFEGTVPEGATSFTLRASRAFPPVHLTILEQQNLAGERQILQKGVPSEPHLLGQPAREPDRLEIAGRYLVLGFWHILPEGLDHILFVLALFLLSTRFAPLLWQVTAFTVAHTITLLLSTYGFLQLSPSIVEPLIALSIAYVAVENLFTDRLRPWRPALVFAFGLLHGLGFAGVLGELGLPREEFLSALLAFNVGVELGQLAVIGIAFLAVGWLRRKPWYRQRIVIPASLLIGACGLYWFVERILQG